MSIKYDFEGYLGTPLRLTRDYKRIPKTTWTPTHTGILIPKIYLNVSFSFGTSTPAKDGRARFRLVRDDPRDETFYFDVELSRGRDVKLDTKTELKYWGDEDLGRSLFWEAKVYDVSTAYLNESSYVAYAQIW